MSPDEVFTPGGVFPIGGGEAGTLIRAHNWSGSPLGAPAGWPPSLRAVVDLLLNSKFPMFLAWGPALGFLYNDAYASILGNKHPDALGAPFRTIWGEIWDDISPLIDAALAGEATYRENLALVMQRNGYDEQTWFTFSYSPVRDERGAVAGLFCACTETTPEVLSSRRRIALLALDDRLREVVDTAELAYAASELLGHALGADRVGYGDFDPDAQTLTVERNWSAPGFVDLAGLHRFTDYGTYAEQLRLGEPVAIADVRGDPRSADRVAAFDAIGLRALLDVPVTENGRTVAQIFVHSGTPRKWTAEEIEFVAQFAARTRTGVERRRAERAVVTSRTELQTLADTLPVLIAHIGTDRRYLFVNQAYATWFPDQWREGLVGRRVRDVVGEEAYAAVAGRLKEAFAGEAVRFEQTMPYGPDNLRHVRIDFTPRRAATGEVVGVYSIVRTCPTPNAPRRRCRKARRGSAAWRTTRR